MMWHRYDGMIFDLKEGNSDIQICDPIYDIGEIGTQDIQMSPGKYRCFYNISNDAYYGQKITASMILRADLEEIWANGGCLRTRGFSAHDLGEIFCKSGIAGFNSGDRANLYSDEVWERFAKGFAKTGNIITHSKDDDFFEQAFFTSAGFGDEMKYRVQVIEFEGRPAGLVIVFIE